MPLLLVMMFGWRACWWLAWIERFAYWLLRTRPASALLMTAYPASRSSWKSLGLLLFGAQYRVYNTADFISLSSGIQIGSVTIDSVQILVLVLGVLLMAGLYPLVNRTRLGRQMRAVAADREAAEMLGINVNFVITATFFLAQPWRAWPESWWAAVQPGYDHHRVHRR